mmetsp:Transcript_11953/g.13492  ORF Transcript_11953/g.13492 Transcript_11953/m.13492 type:complete len:186 (-) Transcript_11953:133-690(-)|eukprot:CAMPEP_0205826734 /NCGR_PEP_ID=MMETSP0206-20130828/29670_1 /ASSEMBLY_ACC=CAM_ASM_000279 /TAXON_ID=36767 /ORGANISM="Euplotes focardii, Strain TN1" /LENGTH=185 /DNA_ID=CAMNT_0053126933 /DNA_START=161 /DNA_END=718 /DNA_ORIENTATION=+
MKAPWDKLGKKYADSKTVMIVDVDCTAGGQTLCGQQGVKGYPTVKYFMSGSSKGIAYQGAREFPDLVSFVKSTLDKEKCDPLTGNYCKKNQIKFLESHKGKTKSELEAELVERKTKFKEVQKAHRDAAKEWRAKERAFKKSDNAYKMIRDFLKALAKAAPTSPPDSGEAEASANSAGEAEAKTDL